MPQIERIADQSNPYEDSFGQDVLVEPCLGACRNYKEGTHGGQQRPPTRESAGSVDEQEAQGQEGEAEERLRILASPEQFRPVQCEIREHTTNHQLPEAGDWPVERRAGIAVNKVEIDQE